MVTFLTPYWSGAEMMRIHLESLRRFHPQAPIVISKRGGGRDEMAGYGRDFGVEYHLEDCGYTNAYLRLLQRCRTRFACIIDHDTVLLAPLDRWIAGVRDGRYDLVGIEERIRLPEAVQDAWPRTGGWLRLAPGNTAANFLLFDWQAFKVRWGLVGVFGHPTPGARHFDFDYGIGQRLHRHHYLQPYHASRYGIGNLLRDGDTPVLWHQWYGSYRTRLAPEGAASAVRRVVEAGERAFIADYPNLDYGALTPAWAPDRDVAAEQRAAAASPDGAAAPRWRRTAAAHARALIARAVVGFERR